ncbi:MAG: nucleotide exchange factor GrpE [Bacteroidales bacterium]
MTDQPNTPRKPDEPELKVVDRRWWARDAAAATTGTDGEAPEERGPRKPSYVEELERQVAEKNDLLQDYITKYKEAAREFDAAKARIRRDVVKDVERGKRTILAELLDVVDNFDRAIDAARLAGETGTLLQGVEMVRAQFLARLEGFGVARMAVLGRAFDPARHEAVSMVPVSDPAQENTVVGVVREGYEMGGDVLRPALVAVGQKEG